MLTFSESTNAYAIDSENIDTVLPLIGWDDEVLWGAVSTEWSNEDKTLTIILGAGDHEVREGHVVTVAPDYIKDADDGDDVAGSAVIDGSFGCGPVIISAMAVDASGAGYGKNDGDMVVVTFDRATNGYPDITESNIGQVLGLDSHSWGAINGIEWLSSMHDNDTLVVYLGSDSPNIAVGDTITANAIGTLIKDAGDTCAAGGSVVLDGSFGEAPSLIYAIACPAGDTLSGIQYGDIVILRFDQSVCPYQNLAAALLLEDQHTWGDFTFAWSESVWENDTVTITFDGTGSPSVSIGDLITIAAGTIKDDTNSVDATSLVEIDGTFGGPPHMLYAWASAQGDAISGIQEDDQVELMFDSATNGYQLSSDPQDENYIDDVLQLPESHTWGEFSCTFIWDTMVYTHDRLTITFTGSGSPDVAVGDSITICPGTIQALSEALDATGSPPDIGGSFGLPTTIISVVALATGSTEPGIQDGDSIVIRFDRSTNAFTIDYNNIDEVLAIGDKQWPGDLAASWSQTVEPYDTLTIEFTADAESPTVEVGDIIQIGEDTIENSINGDDADNRLFIPIGGSFGGSPHLVSAEAVATDPARGIQEDDYVVLTFDTSTNAPSIDMYNINSILQLIGMHSWGEVSAEWSLGSLANDTLTITFTGDGDPSVDVGDAIEIAACQGTIMDAGEEYTAISYACITGTFGGQPKLLYAILCDTSGQGAGIQEEDTAVLGFDQPTNGCNILSENIDDILVLNNDHLWGPISSAEWNDELDTLVITFDEGGHDVEVGDSITIEDETITGLTSGLAALGSPPVISGSASYVPPRAISAVAFDTDPDPGIQAGDYIEVKFDQGTNAPSLDETSLANAMTIPGRYWGDDTVGTWSTTTYTYDTLTITFNDNTSTVAVGDQFQIGNATIMDVGQNVTAVGSPPAITGSFGDDTDPPQITIETPESGFEPSTALTVETVQLAGYVQDDIAVALVTINDVPCILDGSAFSTVIPLNEGENHVTLRACDTSGNEAIEEITLYRDTTPPYVYASELDHSIISSGRLNVTIYFADDVSGIDTSVSPTVTFQLPGEWQEGGQTHTKTLPVVQTSFLPDGTWLGYVDVPSSAPGGTASILVCGAADNVGNVMPDPGTEIAIDGSLPAAPSVDGDCTHSLVSPAYITGGKKEDAVKVVWKYKNEENGKWRVVGTDSVGVSADTWWWTEIDLHVEWNDALQRADVDLSLDHRKVMLQFATVNAAGKMSAIPTEVTITWDVVEGDVQYHDPLVEHLIQQGDEMIFSPAEPYEYQRDVEVEDTHEWWSWDWPVPQNVVHKFQNEGHVPVWFRYYDAFPPGEPGEDLVIVHVLKRLAIDVLLVATEKPVEEDWSDLVPLWPLKLSDWLWSSPVSAEIALVSVPKQGCKTLWAEYRLEDGEKATPPPGYPDSQHLWWSGSLDRITIAASYSTLPPIEREACDPVLGLRAENLPFPEMQVQPGTALGLNEDYDSTKVMYDINKLKKDEPIPFTLDTSPEVPKVEKGYRIGEPVADCHLLGTLSKDDDDLLKLTISVTKVDYLQARLSIENNNVRLWRSKRKGTPKKDLLFSGIRRKGQEGVVKGEVKVCRIMAPKPNGTPADWQKEIVLYVEGIREGKTVIVLRAASDLLTPTLTINIVRFTAKQSLKKKEEGLQRVFYDYGKEIEFAISPTVLDGLKGYVYFWDFGDAQGQELSFREPKQYTPLIEPQDKRLTYDVKCIIRVLRDGKEHDLLTLGRRIRHTLSKCVCDDTGKADQAKGESRWQKLWSIAGGTAAGMYCHKNVTFNIPDLELAASYKRDLDLDTADTSHVGYHLQTARRASDTAADTQFRGLANRDEQQRPQGSRRPAFCVFLVHTNPSIWKEPLGTQDVIKAALIHELAHVRQCHAVCTEEPKGGHKPAPTQAEEKAFNCLMKLCVLQSDPMICFRAYMEAHAYQEELVKGVEPMALDWYRAHGVASMASTQYTRAMEAFVAFRQPEELRTFLKSLYDGMPYEEMRHPEYDLYVRAPR